MKINAKQQSNIEMAQSQLYFMIVTLKVVNDFSWETIQDFSIINKQYLLNTVFIDYSLIRSLVEILLYLNS